MPLVSLYGSAELSRYTVPAGGTVTAVTVNGGAATHTVDTNGKVSISSPAITELSLIAITYTDRSSGSSGAGLNISAGAGASKVRSDKPFAGWLYGADSLPLDNKYTWATRPTAGAAYENAIITITDLGPVGGEDFICTSFDSGVTWYWVPLNGRIKLVQKHPITTPLALDGTQQAYGSFVAPAGLVVPGTQIVIGHAYSFVGATAVKTPRMLINGVTIHAMASAAATSLHYAAYAKVFVSDTDVAVQRFLPITQTTGLGSNGGTAAIGTATLALANAWTVTWTCQGTGPDTASQLQRELELIYPVR